MSIFKCQNLKFVYWMVCELFDFEQGLFTRNPILSKDFVKIISSFESILGNFFYIQTLVMSMDVSKIIWVHFEEVLKDLHTKKGELLQRGVDQKPYFGSSVLARFTMIENVFEPTIFIGYNTRS